MFIEATKTGIPTLPPIVDSLIHVKKKPFTEPCKKEEHQELPPIIKKEHPAILQLVENLRGRVSAEELSGYQSDKLLAEQIMKIAMLHVFKGEKLSRVSNVEIDLVVREITALSDQAHSVIDSLISPHIIRRITRHVLGEHLEKKCVDRLISGAWKRDAMRLLRNIIDAYP